jgi:multidrug efflux pump
MKNGIMMVDFARDGERTLGLDPRAAITRACSLRFRPIMMTTFAAIAGALPLAIAWGEGTEMRRPLGIAIVGGLFVSQMLTLYTTPVVYLAVHRLQRTLRQLFGGGEGSPARLTPPLPAGGTNAQVRA